nr:hypothetical protein [uncultured Cohaesibacter sp.]
MRFAAHLLTWLLLLLATNLPFRAESVAVFSHQHQHHLSEVSASDHSLALVSDPSGNLQIERLKRLRFGQFWQDRPDGNDSPVVSCETAALLDDTRWGRLYPRVYNQIVPTGLSDEHRYSRAPPDMAI